MDKIVFTGIVLPRHLIVRAQSPDDMQWRMEEFDTSVTCKAIIDGMSATVTMTMPQFRVEYITQLHKRATDLARTTANLGAFSTGHAIFVMIDTIIYPHGLSGPAIRQEPSVSPLVTAFSLEPSRLTDFQESFAAVLSDTQIFIALDDLISAITYHHQTQANCGRAIERIRNLITTAKGPSGWRHMQQALNISREFQEKISQESRGNRHGDSEAVPGPLVTKTVERTWAVMNRFIEYRRRGNVALKEPEFPLLVL
jgi:hypothetical protein